MKKGKSVKNLEKGNPQKRGTRKSSKSQKRINRDLKFFNRMINNRNSAFYNDFRFDDFSNDRELYF